LLHDLHVSLGAKMVDFAGWEMPLSYSDGTIAEHMATRRQAGLFDVSHLGTVRLTGPRAAEVVQQELSNDLRKIAPGQAQYHHLLDDDGSVLDDVMIWWRTPELIDVIANAANTDLVARSLGGEDLTETRALLALQGPKAREMLQLVNCDAYRVGRMQVADVPWKGFELTVAGTGYTGEDGLEIAVGPKGALELWEALTKAGATPAGLGARDTLRLEAGLPLHGHELGPGITPLQAGMSWVVGWSKESFRGKEALLTEREEGPWRILRGVVCFSRRPPRAGEALYLGEEHLQGALAEEGSPEGAMVTSGNFSPVLERGIALAFVPPEVLLGEKVGVENRWEGIVVAPPFVKEGRPAVEVPTK
jgi:aminomethyltransferase